MEGKALLFKLFGGVDAIPLCIRARDAEDIVRTVELIEPSFGEQISKTLPSQNVSALSMKPGAEC